MKKFFTFILMLFLLTSFAYAEVVRKTTINKEEGKTVYEFFENNELIAKQIFHLGDLESEEGQIPDGIVKEYHQSGQLMAEGNYQNNRMQGLQKAYYENGNLAGETMMRNGKPDGQTKVYYENGQLKGEMFFKDEKFTGISKGYYENGKIHREIHYSDDSYIPKLNKVYYENGKIKQTIEQISGEDKKQFSLEKNYDMNGNLIKEEKREVKSL